MENVNSGFSLIFPKKVCNAGRQNGDPRKRLKQLGAGCGVTYESPRVPYNWCDNVQAMNCGNDGFKLVEHQAAIGDPQRIEIQTVTQELSADGKTKVTTIIPKDAYTRNTKGTFEMVQTVAEDGTYTCRRVGNGVEHVKEIKPIEGKKALTGFTGKIEKALMKIAQDANGCERPVLRQISGKAIEILRHIR